MITEKFQEERLNNYKINIKTKYFSEDGIQERNTDNSRNDNVVNGIILEKQYYYKNKLLKRENVFDSRINYTYVFNSGDKTISCPNCGNTGSVKDFDNGCPYCNTNYNLSFSEKELGNKRYYDLIMRNRNYIIKTLIIDLIVSFSLSLLYIISTSRTFYIFDFMKVIILTLVLGGLLFFVFYYLDAIITLPKIKRIKEANNNKQIEFWSEMKDKGIDKLKFYNNLNYDLRKFYYSDKNKDIIDYDIIDYNSFKTDSDSNEFYITVNLDIRIVRFINGKIVSNIETNSYKFKRTVIEKELKNEINIISCPNCGASVDATRGECSYCHSKVNYLQEWYLVEE